MGGGREGTQVNPMNPLWIRPCNVKSINTEPKTATESPPVAEAGRALIYFTGQIFVWYFKCIITETNQIHVTFNDCDDKKKLLLT